MVYPSSLWSEVEELYSSSLTHSMMKSSNGNIFRVTGPLCGEVTGPGEIPTQRPMTRSFDVFVDLHLNKRLSKQPWGWWFETPSWSLWRHYNVYRDILAAPLQLKVAELCPGMLSNIGYPPETLLKLKSCEITLAYSLFISYPIVVKFWNFTQSTAAILPCCV